MEFFARRVDRFWERSVCPGCGVRLVGLISRPSPALRLFRFGAFSRPRPRLVASVRRLSGKSDQGRIFREIGFDRVFGSGPWRVSWVRSGRAPVGSCFGFGPKNLPRISGKGLPDKSGYRLPHIVLCVVVSGGDICFGLEPKNPPRIYGIGSSMCFGLGLINLPRN